jgi:hypothetical protein
MTVAEDGPTDDVLLELCKALPRGDQIVVSEVLDGDISSIGEHGMIPR